MSCNRDAGEGICSVVTDPQVVRKDNPGNCTGVKDQRLAKHLPGVCHNCRKQSRGTVHKAIAC